jgi:GR25 family glycosyltransferase involved in LPS biosynthesis
MKAYVITIIDMERSVEIAQRCIDSAKIFGVEVEMFKAITPKDNVYEIAEERGINLSGFDERYSRKENAIACFLSHHSIWNLSLKNSESILVLEHDAIFVGDVNLNMKFKGLISLGKPSYGKYSTPRNGISPLTSKGYLPGAHAYILKPNAATDLINKSKECAKPADIFIDRNTFSWIEEYYPWPIEARDTFTTVQKKAGCVAKHSYTAGFEII